MGARLWKKSVALRPESAVQKRGMRLVRHLWVDPRLLHFES